MDTNPQLLVVAFVIVLMVGAFAFNWRRDALQRQRSTPVQREVRLASVAKKAGTGLFVLTFIGPIVHILIAKTGLIETFLLYFLVVRVGLGGLWSFSGHFFFAEQVAEYIGWPAGNPFQKEIAFTNLSFGTLGVLCIWWRENFWIAVGIGVSIFLLGAAFVHIQDIRKSQNFKPGNAGSVLVGDLLNPLILSILLLAQHW
jgi:hypothetical protein